MGPQHVLMGDASPAELPVQETDEKLLIEEKKMAQYVETAEFQRIKQHCEDRIAFYQTYLPNGAEVGMDVVPSPEDWRVANRVIGEFKLLMGMYDITKEAVEDELQAR